MSQLDINLKVDLPEIEHQLKRLADEFTTPEWRFDGGTLTLNNLISNQIVKTIGGDIMFRVPATQANVPYSIELPKVVNAEGGVVPGWTVTSVISSDDDTAIKVVGDPTLLTGELEVVGAEADGTPNQATVTVEFTATHPTDTDSPRSNQLAEVFIVEAGDEVGFAGGGITFSGLVSEPTV
jgi:hypothetical protein